MREGRRGMVISIVGTKLDTVITSSDLEFLQGNTYDRKLGVGIRKWD